MLCFDQMRSPYSEVLVTSLDKRVDDNKDTPSICSHFNNLFSKSFSGKMDLSQVQEVVSLGRVVSQDSAQKPFAELNETQISTLNTKGRDTSSNSVGKSKTRPYLCSAIGS